jgi:subtilisin family serine protease
MPWAWTIRTAANVVVAVVDSGVNYVMPDLAANIWTNPVEFGGVQDVDDDNNGVVDDIHGAAFPGEDEPDPRCIDAGIGPFCEGSCLVSPCDYGPGDPYDVWNGNPDYPCPLKDPAFGGSHGTPVAQLIGGIGNNGSNISGVAWSVVIMPIRLFGTCQMFRQNETLYTSSVVSSFDYAALNSASIINCSFGLAHSDALFDSIKALYEDFNIVVVASAGNHARNLDAPPVGDERSWPARYNLPNVLAVAATTQKDELAEFSNFGESTVDVAAPGENLIPFPNSYYAGATPPCNCMVRGTSFAAPIVSGIAALCRAQYPNKSAADVVEHLVTTSRPHANLEFKVRSGGVVSAAGVLGVPCTR